MLSIKTAVLEVYPVWAIHTAHRTSCCPSCFRSWWCHVASDPAFIDSRSGLVIWDSNWAMKDFLCLWRISSISLKARSYHTSPYQRYISRIHACNNVKMLLNELVPDSHLNPMNHSTKLHTQNPLLHQSMTEKAACKLRQGIQMDRKRLWGLG